MKAVRKYDNGGDIVKKLAKARDKRDRRGKQYFKEYGEGVKEEVTSLSKSLKKGLGKALGTTTQSKGSKSVPKRPPTKAAGPSYRRTVKDKPKSISDKERAKLEDISRRSKAAREEREKMAATKAKRDEYLKSNPQAGRVSLTQRAAGFNK